MEPCIQYAQTTDGVSIAEGYRRGAAAVRGAGRWGVMTPLILRQAQDEREGADHPGHESFQVLEMLYSPADAARPQPGTVATVTKATAKSVRPMSNPTVRMRTRDTMGTSSSLLYSSPEYGLLSAGAVMAITVSAMRFSAVSGRDGPCFW